MASEGASSENFTSMSREFSALVIAGTIGNLHSNKMNRIIFFLKVTKLLVFKHFKHKTKFNLFIIYDRLVDG